MLKLHEQVARRTGGKAMMRQAFCSAVWFLSKYRSVSHLQTWEPSVLNLTAYYKTNKPGQTFCILSVITLFSAIPLDKCKLNVLLTYLNNHQKMLELITPSQSQSGNTAAKLLSASNEEHNVLPLAASLLPLLISRIPVSCQF